LFTLPVLELNSLLELPFVIFLGLCCGVSVSVFIAVSKFAARAAHWPVALRFALAGAFTGILALKAPEILGIGYDTLDLALQGQIALSMLLTIAVCKLLATAISCGVGMPIGLIGPNLLIGACIGGALGALGAHLQPDLASDPRLYIVIGMGAAMGAVLNAPLAAILAIIELTHTLNVSVAAMLAIVAATLTNTGIFGQASAHLTVLKQLNRRVPNDPLNQLLHRTNVNSNMDTRVVRVPVIISGDDLEPLLEFKPAWCVATREGEDLYLVSGSELLDWLAEMPLDESDADITDAAIRRWAIAGASLQATLKEVVDTMRRETAEAICIYERSTNTGKRILHGVLTREDIEKFTLGALQQ